MTNKLVEQHMADLAALDDTQLKELDIHNILAPKEYTKAFDKIILTWDDRKHCLPANTTGQYICLDIIKALVLYPSLPPALLPDFYAVYKRWTDVMGDTYGLMGESMQNTLWRAKAKRKWEARHGHL